MKRKKTNPNGTVQINLPASGGFCRAWLMVRLLLAILSIVLWGGTSNGQLLVSTLNPISVNSYSLSGTPLQTPFIPGTQLGWPGDIAVANGYVYVVNNGGSVGKFTLSGAFVATVVSGLFDPWGIAVDGDYVYVASGTAGGVVGTGSVGKYTTSGQTINASLISGLGRSHGIAADGNGHLFVTDGYNGVVGHYTIGGAVINKALISGVFGAFDIALHDSYLYLVKRSANGSVGKYTLAGQTVNSALVTGLDFPAGIALDGAGNLFVSDLNHDRVGKYTINGGIVNASLISLDAPTGAVVPEPSALSLALLLAPLLWLRQWSNSRHAPAHDNAAKLLIDGRSNFPNT
jgi:hypothetical protein